MKGCAMTPHTESTFFIFALMVFIGARAVSEAQAVPVAKSFSLNCAQEEECNLAILMQTFVTSRLHCCDLLYMGPERTQEL